MSGCRKAKKARAKDTHDRCPDWYKDAAIYQLHVRAFYDSNNDGVGDFCGLAEKLDYIKDLGVNAIWLLPFYESPLRDDGYDISDYKAINPAYGTLDEIKPQGSVEQLLENFPVRLKESEIEVLGVVLDALMGFIFIFVAAILAWRLIDGGLTAWERSRRSMFLQLPDWWGYAIGGLAMVVWIAVCCWTTYLSFKKASAR